MSTGNKVIIYVPSLPFYFYRKS